jgi:hypothetical protein
MFNKIQRLEALEAESLEPEYEMFVGTWNSEAEPGTWY